MSSSRYYRKTRLYHFDEYLTVIMTLIDKYISINTRVLISAVFFVYILFYYSDFTSYLRQVHKVALPPNFAWSCRIGIMVFFTSSMCSTFFVISMTFDRFYSIVRPYKAASVNTMRRAKVTIIFIILFSILFHIPHLFIDSVFSNQCVTFFGVMGTKYGQLYYWITYIMSYVLPFILLLIMNGVIIHFLRQRLK